MKELWELQTCRTCGDMYFFGDGPQCKCQDELVLWEEEFAAEFKEDLLGE